jgi:predicted amidohydrolase YtcJ
MIDSITDIQRLVPGRPPRGILRIIVSVVTTCCLCGFVTRASAGTACSPEQYTNDPYMGWCPADCNGNRAVAVNELVGLVGIALGQRPPSECRAGDRDGDGTVKVNEIVSGVTAGLGGCPPGVDLVLRNAEVFTADPERPAAEALAICGDRIAAVGANDALRGLADSHTMIIDSGGRTIIPGFNDAHKHVTVTRDLPLVGGNEDPSLDAVIAAVEQQAQRAAPGARIGTIIGPVVLDDPLISRFALDAVAPNHHVFLEAFTAHGLVFNTQVMTLLGLAEDEPDPPGGFFVREPDSQVLRGIAHEYAQLLMNRQLAAMVTDAAAAAIYASLDRLFARRGITSVQLMTTGQTTIATARALVQANPSLRWRLIRVPMPTDPTWPLDDLSGVEAFQHPRVTISGLKYFLDGTPIERLAAMREPYADREGWSGRMNFSAEDIEGFLRSALDAGEQPMFHLGGDQAIETLLTAMEAVATPETWRQVRPRFEHGDLLLPDLRERAQRLGAVVVQNPLHFTSGTVFEGRFRPERRGELSPMRSLLQEQFPVALGSDSPITALENVRYAVEHSTNPAEALTREQAIVAHTSGSAYAELAELEKGQLRPGMLADLAVLSQDILTIPLAALSNTESVLTVVGGQIVYRAAGI